MARPSDPQARERLLQAAREEFVEHGLDAAKVETIARRAGLSKGAFYLHFKSKAELFAELVHSVMHQLGLLVSDALERPPLAGTDTAKLHLERWLEADVRMFEFLIAQRDIMNLIFEGGGSGTTRHLICEFCGRVEEQIALLLKNGIEIGLYRSDLNVEMAAAFLAGGYDRAARRLIEQPGPYDLRELVREWQRQAVAGVGTPLLIQAASPKAL
jgi:AcrR family transcriptional regulator